MDTQHNELCVRRAEQGEQKNGRAKCPHHGWDLTML